MTASTIHQIIDLHSEEVGIHWLRRDRGTEEPHYRLLDLAQLDERLDAHLDGLRIAGDDGWQICLAELENWNDSGELFAAAFSVWESGNAKRARQIIKAGAQSYDCFRALVSSLGWLRDEQAEPHLERLLGHSKAVERRIGIAACAVRRSDPGEALAKAVASRDRLLKARALLATGELGRRDLVRAARQALRSRDLQVQFAAAWSVARLMPDEPALRVLRKTVVSQSRDCGRALQLALRRMNPTQAAEWINTLSQNPHLLRSAVIGVGVVGVPDSIPWLLEMMAAPALARVAGEALAMITGVDLAADRLEGKWPAGFTAGPTEDPADDNVAMDDDENLPWPDAAKLATWWEIRRSDFEPGARHLCGRPMTDEWLEHVLRHGYQRQRAAAALELALRRPDQPLFNVRAPGHRQQELLRLR